MIKSKVKILLDKKNKSIYWLADNTKLTYTTVYNFVNNKSTSIHFNTLNEIMQALDITDFNKILEIVPEEEE